jgi:Lipase/Calx-beta domain/CARDB/Domain of unknown function (DUF4114)/RTX calcium-binding nonapeptide repeat (4 copies)
MLNNSLTSQAFPVVRQYLAQFAARDDFESSIASIFGTEIDRVQLAKIREQWLDGDFSIIPEIEILDRGELGTANGAYAASLDSPSGTLRERILVSADFLAQHGADLQAIAGLLLEEIGHKLDRVLNGSVDSRGDEGAIFRLLVTGETVSDEILAGLRGKDDRATILLDGNAVEIEKQDFFGDAGGVVTNDSIVGTTGDDTISPGLGIDQVDGGDGIDTLVVDYSANDYTGTGRKGIRISSGSLEIGLYKYNGSGSFSAAKGTSNDLDQIEFSSIERLKITGTKYDDNILGGSGDDILQGGLGNDTLIGNGGIDVVTGGAGQDTFDLHNYAAHGNGDYALIKDFNPNDDELVLDDLNIEFTVADTSNIPGVTGAALFKGTDLVAVFEGKSVTSLYPIDLAVTKIEIPTKGNPGQKTTISYTVTNQGTGQATGTWEDTIYLSKDGKWDLNDVVLGRISRTGGLSAGESYNQSITANLPGVTDGEYQVIVRSDIRNNLIEANETNNTIISTNKLVIDVKKLVTGTLDTGTLGQDQSVYYRVDVAAGETLALNFDSQSNFAANELYIRYGDMPTRSEFDLSANKALAPDREIVIPTTRAGTYYLLAYGKSVAESAPNYSVEAKLLDFGLRSISTKSGGNVGNITIEISGAKFDQNTILTLSDEKLGIEIAPSRVDVVDSTKIFATFDLKGAKADVYDLVAKNSSNKVSKLLDSFTITEGGKANLVTNIVAPAVVRPDAITPITIQFTNTGNVDLPTPLAILTSDTQAPIALNREDLLNQTSLELLLQSASSPAGVLAPGATGSITFYANSLSSLSSLKFSLNVLDDPSTPLNWDSYIKDVQSQDPESFADPTANANFWKNFRSSFGETVGDIQSNLVKAQQLSLAVASQEAATSDIPFLGKDYLNISLDELYSIASFASSYGANQPVVNTTTFDTNLAIAPILSGYISNITIGESNTELKDKLTFPFRPAPYIAGFINGTKVYFNVWNNSGIVKGGTVDITKNTYIIIHGFQNTGGNPDNNYKPEDWMAEMANSLKQREPDSNVILVDWQNGAALFGVNNILNLPYVSAAETTQLLGDAIGQYILKKGYDVSKVTLIGHSLGAQAAGDAGEYIIAKTTAEGNKKEIGAIIGMDAAAPLFEPDKLDYKLITNNDKFLDKSDATKVIGIHTSLGDDGIAKTQFTGYGFISPYADQDIYINPVRSGKSRLLDYDHPGGAGYSPVYDHGYAYKILNRLLKGEKIVDPNSGGKDILNWDNLNNRDLYLDTIDNYPGKVWDFQERQPGVNLNPKAIIENSAEGTPIGIFTVKDKNLSSRRVPVFSLIDNAGGIFKLDKNKLVVANKSLLDYEKARSHSIKVETKIQLIDSGSSVPVFSDYDKSEEFTIQILDENEKVADNGKTYGGNRLVSLTTNRPPNSQNQSSVVRPSDPNDIIGPAGFGDDKWITPQTLPYIIRFENKASATAPAQTVTIINPLDSDLDFGTFSLGSFGWGEFVFDVPPNRSFYSQRFDLTETYGFVVDVIAGIDIQKSQAFWTLTTIDPETGEPPTNPLIGFLPPNKEDGIGNGFVNYTINPRNTVKTGDVIDAKAAIVFDTEAPIDTPVWLNKIDINPPASKVQTLATTTTGKDINVTWAGTDDGSGVGTYDVYVSIDGGAYTLWQSKTAKTTATYTGEIGKTYSFYSIATDNIGRTEIKTATAETTTKLVATIPTISILTNDADAAETKTGETANPGQFTLTRTGDLTQTLTVNYTLSGTANNSTDYQTLPGTVTFTAGKDTATIDLNVIDDNIFEGTETVTLSLAANPAYIIPAAPSPSINIADNDTKPTVNISDVSVKEGDSGTTNATFTVSLSNPSTQTITVNYATADGTATAGSDYTKVDKTTLTFAPGETSKTVNVAVNGDTTFEADETFKLNLSDAVNATITTTSATGTIVNDDAIPLPVISLAVTDADAAEPNNPGQFTLTRTGATTADLTVNYTITGTATNGTDYQTLNGTATFAAGINTATINVNPTDDNTFEGNETVIITLNDGSTNYTLDPVKKSGTITITDNEIRPTISIANITQNEGNSGTTNYAFNLTLSNPSTETITVKYTTADDTAQAVSDYTTASGTVTFNPGETTKTVNVAVNGDTLYEADETFKLNLSDAVNATIATTSATGTIVNDDAVPLPVISLAVTDPDAAETPTGQPANPGQFTLTRTGATTADLTVNYTIAGTATNGTDDEKLTGTATFKAGSTTTTVDVKPIDDNIYEGNETVILTLVDGSTNYKLDSAKSTGTVTITDNETRPTISISDATPATGKEGDPNAKNRVFTIALSNPSTETITVDYTTLDGTAVAGSDYTATQGKITFNPGETTQTITATILDDAIFEDLETFKVKLTNPSNSTLAKAEGTATILDDDLPGISLIVTDSEAAETKHGKPTNPGQFTLKRTGSTTNPLTVQYALKGSATNGIDYQKLPDTITFAAGSDTASIDINVIDDKIYEGTEKVILNLCESNDYTIVGEKSGTVSIADNDLKIPQLTQPTQNCLEIEGGTEKSLLKFTKMAHEALNKSEVCAFVVDDEQGRIGGIKPGETGYLAAALDRSQVVFSNLGNNPKDNEFDRDSQRYLNFTPGKKVHFALISDDTLDSVKQTLRERVKADLTAGKPTAKVLFSLPEANNGNASQANFTTLANNGGYEIAWEDNLNDGKTTPDFNDLVLKVETLDNFTPPVGTGLQGNSEGEVIDLRGLAGQNLKVDLRSLSDAAYNNYIGFYEVEDDRGTLASGLKVGDLGYAQAAIQGAILRTFKTEAKSDLTATGGKILAPVVIANGTFEDYLKTNPQNQANSNIHAYFNYLEANSDKVDHFRLLGDNKFGVEDMYGGGDKDYNDIVFQMTVKS